MNKEETKTKIVEISKEERDSMLEDLVFKGVVYYNKSLFDGKLKIKFKSTSGEEQLLLEERMPDMKGSPAKVVHLYTIWLLSYSLTMYGDKNLASLSVEERFEYIQKLPRSVLDALSLVYNEFQAKLKAVTNGDVIEEVLFKSPSIS